MSSMVKKVIWAMDKKPSTRLIKLLEKEFGDSIEVFYAGYVSSSEEVLRLMKRYRIGEVIVEFGDVCEVEKLLDRGIYPIIALIKFLHRCSGPSACVEYDPDLDFFEERGGELEHMRIVEFKRIVDIMFKLEDIREKCNH